MGDGKNSKNTRDSNMVSPRCQKQKMALEQEDSALVNVRMATEDDASPLRIAEAKGYSRSSVVHTSNLSSGVGGIRNSEVIVKKNFRK